MSQRIGALWLKQSRNGIKFLAGEITLAGVKHKIVIFKNKSKKKDSHPDYEILPGQDRLQQQQPSFPANPPAGNEGGEPPEDSDGGAPGGGSYNW